MVVVGVVVAAVCVVCVCAGCWLVAMWAEAVVLVPAKNRAPAAKVLIKKRVCVLISVTPSSKYLLRTAVGRHNIFEYSGKRLRGCITALTD